MYKHNSDCITGGTWYNTFICKKLHRKLFEEFIRNSRNDRYNLMCSIDAHLKKIVHHNMVMEAAFLVIHYHQIKQQRHYFHSVQPSISLVVGCKL